MYINLNKRLATIAMLTAVVMGIGSGTAFADTANKHNDNEESQMNHEQMMNSDGEEMQMPMQECSDNPDAQMDREQMSSSEHQMSMKQCSDASNTEMNHEQMMNSDGEEMQMPNDDDSSTEK